VILVVDDEDPVRRALCRILSCHGYGVDAVSSVDEARHALRRTCYELVL